ncbi:hypothetical protein [Flavobacterium cerinum]|uniref:Uncharacterized protein n=1 Tax=Flavobacterium cerinum TaxID=2502784 RepID=A0A3S3U341_9FLAO|nr:hypothetical protein [Flavobacterium cerinum]RWX03749.1 hypothetical protein EPI11_02120 [Flavobacterium cerinum]
MKLTKQDLQVALIFFVIFQLASAVIWIVYDANYFMAMLCGCIGAYYGGYYRNKKSSIQKQ